MRTLTHIRCSAARVAGLSLFMALLGIVSTTWVDQISALEIGGCDSDVRCITDVSMFGVIPFVGASVLPAAPPAGDRSIDPEPVHEIARDHQRASPSLKLLAVAPKTSPPA